MPAALAQPTDSTDIRHLLDQGGQPLSSPGMPEQARSEQKTPDNAGQPAISQLCLPPTTEPAGGALQSSPEGKSNAGSGSEPACVYFSHRQMCTPTLCYAWDVYPLWPRGTLSAEHKFLIR